MFRNFAKKLALIKPSPNIIPMSLPRCADNDFYSVHIEVPEHGIKLNCKSESENGLEGFLWVNDEDGAEACVLKSTLDKSKWTLKVEHYYKGWVLEYNSSFLFIIQNIFQKHRFLYSKDKLAQTIFNNKKLVRSERIKVLEYVLEQTSIKPDYRTGPLYLGMELYSKRWLFHPDRESMNNHYKLIFESLLHSGDLTKVDHSYKLSPQALNTISEYERDEQKHFDSQNSAKKTRNLTKAIIVLGLLNLGFQMLKWVYESNIQP
ncbi:MAG: hypothetical protein ACJAUJ_001695 [Salibacteraceae bacterium]|jgi:hypothetical protein